MTTPTLFIEKALLHLGREISDGLDYRSRTEKVTQIITFWHEMGEVDTEERSSLLKYWQELLIVIVSHDKEFGIRQREGKTDIEDLKAEARNALENFYESVGDCLDSLAVLRIHLRGG